MQSTNYDNFISRAILLAPSYQIPIDTSTQIAENKMVCLKKKNPQTCCNDLIFKSVVLQARESLHLNYFLTSPVPAQVKMMENVVFVNVSVFFISLQNVYFNKI